MKSYVCLFYMFDAVGELSLATTQWRRNTMNSISILHRYYRHAELHVGCLTFG